MSLFESLRIEHAALKNDLWELKDHNEELTGRLERISPSKDPPPKIARRRQQRRMTGHRSKQMGTTW